MEVRATYINVGATGAAGGRLYRRNAATYDICTMAITLAPES